MLVLPSCSTQSINPDDSGLQVIETANEVIAEAEQQIDAVYLTQCEAPEVIENPQQGIDLSALIDLISTNALKAFNCREIHNGLVNILIQRQQHE